MQKAGDKKNSRGQVTIFIIIAVVIIVAAALLYQFGPGLGINLGLESKNPSSFLQSCLEEDVKESVAILSAQGGSIEPKHYLRYNNEKIEYLCYTGEYYQTCVMQQPLLQRHIETEIKNEIRNSADVCFDSMKESYEGRGYDVDLRKADMWVELVPNQVLVKFNHTMTLTKEESERHESFVVSVDNNLYELVNIANSILNWEARYGDSETTIYMNYYHDLKVEKLKQSDGSTVYILTDRDTQDKFQFASRSLAWPPGYGTEEMRY